MDLSLTEEQEAVRRTFREQSNTLLRNGDQEGFARYVLGVSLGLSSSGLLDRDALARAASDELRGESGSIASYIERLTGARVRANLNARVA